MMRTGDINLENELPRKGYPSNDSNKKKALEQAPVMVTLFPLLSMFAAVIPELMKHNPFAVTVKVGILVFILTSVASFYIRYNYRQFQSIQFGKTIIILSYLMSICLLLLLPNPQCYHFWMLGGLVVAMLIDKKLGLLLHFNLSVLLGLALTMSIGSVLQVLIIGVMLCFLSEALQGKSTVIYATIILLSMNITVAFIINNFKFDIQTNYDYLLSMLSLLVVIVISFLLSMFYHSFIKSLKSDANTKENSVEQLLERQGFIQDKQQEKNSAWISSEPGQLVQDSTPEIAQNENLSALEVAAVEEVMKTSLSFQETKTNYDVLCDQNNILLQEMKEYSKELFQHALTIGDLSHRAAIAIGANKTLTLAGGLYHEVGKIKGKNYMEEGQVLADEYGFPNELKAILREHNIKYDKPSSVEAVIVMLADNIVTTIEYIEKNDDRKFTTQKIIENIFQLRMDKGTFDSANLSLKDYKLLKEFFVNEFSVKQE